MSSALSAAAAQGKTGVRRCRTPVARLGPTSADAGERGLQEPFVKGGGQRCPNPTLSGASVGVEPSRPPRVLRHRFSQTSSSWSYIAGVEPNNLLPATPIIPSSSSVTAREIERIRTGQITCHAPANVSGSGHARIHIQRTCGNVGASARSSNHRFLHSVPRSPTASGNPRVHRMSADCPRCAGGADVIGPAPRADGRAAAATGGAPCKP